MGVLLLRGDTKSAVKYPRSLHFRWEEVIVNTQRRRGIREKVKETVRKQDLPIAVTVALLDSPNCRHHREQIFVFHKMACHVTKKHPGWPP
jgi:hypothetical protein